MLPRLTLLFLALLVGTVSVADPMPPAQQIIQQMSEANHKINYSGTFIYNRHGHMDTMRIIHRADGDDIQERIIALTGSAREVVRNNRFVTCVIPDNATVLVEKSNPRQFNIHRFPEQVDRISDYYTFSIAGQERVANRSAWVVDVKPKDEYRYGYVLWVDLDTKLLLKSELKNKDNVLLEQFIFTELEIMEEISDKWLEPDEVDPSYIWHDNSVTTTAVPDEGAISWQATWLPNGFVINDQNQTPMQHLVYSDGLALVSIFIEQLEQPKSVVTGPSSIGGINVFSAIFDSHLITAIGEVPEDTVRLIAQSISARN